MRKKNKNVLAYCLEENQDGTSSVYYRRRLIKKAKILNFFVMRNYLCFELEKTGWHFYRNGKIIEHIDNISLEDGFFVEERLLCGRDSIKKAHYFDKKSKLCSFYFNSFTNAMIDNKEVVVFNVVNECYLIMSKDNKEHAQMSDLKKKEKEVVICTSMTKGAFDEAYVGLDGHVNFLRKLGKATNAMVFCSEYRVPYYQGFLGGAYNALYRMWNVR